VKVCLQFISVFVFSSAVSPALHI